MNVKINYVSKAKKSMLVTIERTVMLAGMKIKQNLNGWLFADEELTQVKGDTFEIPNSTKITVKETVSDTGSVFNHLIIGE